MSNATKSLIKIHRGFKLMMIKGRSEVMTVISTIVISMLSFTASADDYLKMIEGEAEDLSLDKSGQIRASEPEVNNSADGITKKDWSFEGDLEDNSVPSGLAQDEFATFLKQRYYGTFVFYRKLSSVDQNTVYYRYTQSSQADTSANLDSVRQDILSFLKQ